MAKAGTEIDFGQLARDPTNTPIQSPTKFSTQDATGTPKTSPLNYSSSIITITVPNDAVQFIISPTTDLRISEDSTMSRYDIIAAGSKEAVNVALMSSVYIVRDAVDGIARFRFARV